MPNLKTRAHRAVAEAIPLELSPARSDADNTMQTGKGRADRQPAINRQPLLVFIDGAARGNPGPASVGVVVREPGSDEPTSISRFLGRRTNNQAEYEALLAALRELERRQGLPTPASLSPEILIRTDSELLFRQMTGRYRIKDPQLIALAWEARKIISRLGKVSFERIPRNENREADRLANQALDRASAGEDAQ
jgi:ribonuclease HI/probable phosphoglycerate mutase